MMQGSKHPRYEELKSSREDGREYEESKPDPTDQEWVRWPIKRLIDYGASRST
jgi:hypothetical protein